VAGILIAGRTTVAKVPGPGSDRAVAVRGLVREIAGQIGAVRTECGTRSLIFSGLYNVDPSILGCIDVAPRCAVNRAVVEDLFDGVKCSLVVDC